MKGETIQRRRKSTKKCAKKIDKKKQYAITEQRVIVKWELENNIPKKKKYFVCPGHGYWQCKTLIPLSQIIKFDQNCVVCDSVYCKGCEK